MRDAGKKGGVIKDHAAALVQASGLATRDTFSNIFEHSAKLKPQQMEDELLNEAFCSQIMSQLIMSNHSS